MVKAVSTLVWVITGLAMCLLMSLPIGIKAQMTLGLCCIFVMTFIKSFRLEGVFRHVFLALGTAIVLRYYYWRTTNTLPPVEDLLNFIPGVLLWSAEVYSGIMLAISLFVISDPLKRKPAALPDYDNLPTVDVFIPTYNEDKGLLAITIAAAVAMDYPKEKFNVYLLDDGGTDQKCFQKDMAKAAEARQRRAELQELAANLGAIYITRAKNLHAKAGNMNNGLGQTNGELIVVFDADHVPMSKFLKETVGYFREDPKLFLCQTPHFFSNPDPLEKNLDTYETMPSENEMFYGVIQRGLDKWNAAFFCGSAAVVRRAALMQVGGFSGITITEDCETALDLHSRGWTSVYVDKPMICGLQPDTFASFITQRSRWCRGMFQIFLLKNPMFKKGLSLAQKICYLSNMTYWFFPIFRLPFIIAPLLYIWFSMKIYVANAQEFFAYTTVYMIANMMMQNYLYGALRWTWVSELYEYVQSVYLWRGLISVMLNPRKPTFDVTDKGLSSEEDRLSELSMPFFAIFGIILVSEMLIAFRWFTEAGAKDLLMIVAIWNTFNLVMSGAALGVITERRSPRIKVSRAVELKTDHASYKATMSDISFGGCRLILPAPTMKLLLAKESFAHIQLLETSKTADKISVPLPVIVSNSQADSEDVRIGFRFPDLTIAEYRVVVDLMYPDMENLSAVRDKRQRKKTILAGVFGFLRWGMVGPVRALRCVQYGFAQKQKLAKQLRDEAFLSAAAKTAALSVVAGTDVKPADAMAVADVNKDVNKASVPQVSDVPTNDETNWALLVDDTRPALVLKKA